MNKKIKDILSCYASDNPGTKANLARILMAGKLGGTGKMIILPVDQGFEHGPDVSFAVNPEAYDPLYHHSLAIEAGLSAYAAPLGMLECSAATFAGEIPLILKVNSSNSLLSKSSEPNQAITGTVDDALRLGCSAIGFTIYPGSGNSLEMMEEIREMASEAKSAGLAVLIWSYARGGIISREGENALDVIAYAAHIAALLGAHIIKVKPPVAKIETANAQAAFGKVIPIPHDLTGMVKHVVRACFDGKRLIVFSGGVSKGVDDILSEATAIRDGGGNGSIIGRNTFQRPRTEALKLLEKMIAIYLKS